MAHFNTGLRFDAKKRLEQIETADIAVGVPAHNNKQTVSRVITTASQGIVNGFISYKQKRYRRELVDIMCPIYATLQKLRHSFDRPKHGHSRRPRRRSSGRRGCSKV